MLVIKNVRKLKSHKNMHIGTYSYIFGISKFAQKFVYKWRLR